MSIMRSDGWLGVELRHLAALQAVAEEGSFGRAAERLGYTQSAVSQQIQALERVVGQRLVERPGGPRRVSLTEAGELLLRHAAGIVARLQAAQADLAAFAEGSVGTLRVGTFQSVGARVLPRLLRKFTETWPDVSVQLTEAADDGALLDAVERGELDFAFVMLPGEEGPFESLELMRDPYVVVLPTDSPLAGRPKPPSLREVAAMPLIGNRQCRSVHQIENRFHDAGLEPRIVFRSDDNGTIQELVAAGVGAALVPLLTVDPNHEGTVVIGLESVPPRRIGLAWHRDRYRSPAARAFAELAAEVCARVESDLMGEAAAAA
jgi:molybdate transport repressor ModE-like protein